MRLREISADRYARDVLPLTAPLWAAGRSFDEYVAQTTEIARSPYGRRHYRTIGLYDGATLVASFKRYERRLRHGRGVMSAIGFGAVFTPTQHRGRGYASLMLAMALDGARRDGDSLAFLFSDIHPQFYAEIGFRRLPSRQFTLRADGLRPARIALGGASEEDWKGIRRVFERGERLREAAFLRDASVWRWIELRAAQRVRSTAAGGTNLVVRRRGQVVAYVVGARKPQDDAYALEEYGCADESAEILPALLRAAAGDLQRITGWLPPDGLRDRLPRSSVRQRARSILMMAPLRPEGQRVVDALAAPSRGDFCWPADHV